MKICVPDYYKDFVCIAGDCKHNCCIGWEIDIDEDAYAYYKGVPGEFGKRLQKGICTDGTPHFALGDGERCPFLNQRGLCDIITELGEDKLCQICSDHPRFRNDYEDRTEFGLGLCCEAAAKLILTGQEKTEVVLQGGGVLPKAETGFFAFRARVLSALQDREKSMQARVELLCAQYEIALPQKSLAQWCAFYEGLEQLDATWTTRLHTARENAYMPGEVMQEQLACYFIYRHLSGGLEDGCFAQRIAFALHATSFICALSAGDEDFLEIARMYSAEIEYSAENTEAVLSMLK